MLLDQETLRFIFGLKLRGLRLDKGLSLKELSKKTGLSPSYLNEIEKGKKYPKSEKILSLAEALGESYDDLISLKLKKELALVSQLLEKNVFTGMPFDIFGIPAATLFELFADRPKKMSALVGTLIEIARGHNVTVDDFFYATLRAYLDMHQNYFPGIEEKVEQFREQMGFGFERDASKVIEKAIFLLNKHYKAQVIFENFEVIDSSIKDLLYFTKKNPAGVLQIVVNKNLDVTEHAFILCRELSYNYMKIKVRPKTSLVANLDSFEQLFNHFSASYFASALLIPQQSLLIQLEKLLSSKTWDNQLFQEIVTSYPTPYESVFHRMSQLLPRFFGLDQLFFLRYEHSEIYKRYQLVKELHLSALHAPHAVKNDEHYCARWITHRLIQQFRNNPQKVLTGHQKSQFYGTSNEYLLVSVAFSKNADQVACVSLGLLITQKARQKIQFLDDPQLQSYIVSDTCERCAYKECDVRQAPYNELLDPARHSKITDAIEKYLGASNAV